MLESPLYSLERHHPSSVIHTWNDCQGYKLLLSFCYYHPAQYKLFFCGCNYPHSAIYMYMYFFICTGCAWQIQNCITKSNTDTVINKLCICRWFYSKGHLHHRNRGWRCVVYTNCLFSWAALNLIRPQTLMPYSPVEHNGLSNAMKSLSPPARSPYVSDLMAWRLHRMVWPM